MFNVGDQVEILGISYWRLKKSVGMIGEITSVNTFDYTVKLPEKVNGDNEWFYLERHLKGVRGNK